MWAARTTMAGDGVGLQNFPKLAAIVEQAKKGNARAQFKLGDYYYAKGEFQAAVLWYDQSARQGHAVAQTALANCYAAGRGVKRNPTLAAKWSRMAAHQKALPPEAVQREAVQASQPQESPEATLAGKSPLTPTASVTPDDGAEVSGAAARTTATPALPVGGTQRTPSATLVSQLDNKRDVPSTVVRRVWMLEAPQPVIRAD